MRNKGSDPYCCCTGCEQPPVMWSDSITFGQHFLLQTGCCSCVPQQACVSIIDPAGKAGSAIFQLYCPTTGHSGLVQPLYEIAGSAGGIEVNHDIIDLVFYFLVNNGQCMLAIRSTALDIDENSYGATRVVDSSVRNPPNDFCSTLAMDGLGYTEFTIPTSMGTYKVRISAADNVPIVGRPQCEDENGIILPDPNPLYDLCCNCNCICNCMCLVISSADGHSSETACLYTGGGWKFSNGVSVSIGPIGNLDFTQSIGCWDLDETSGTRIDATGQNNLLDSGGVSSASGIINRCAVFAGHQLLYSDNSEFSLTGVGVTIACWVKFTYLSGSSGDMAIMSKTNGNSVAGFSWKLWYNNSANRLTFSASNGTTIVSVAANSFGAVSQNIWYFVSCRIDTQLNTISIQVNNAGTTVDSTSFAGTIPLTTGPFCIGAQNSATVPQFLIGNVDQAIIIKNMLPSGEMQKDWGPVLYNVGKGRPCHGDDSCYLQLNGTDTAYGVKTPPLPVLLDPVENPCPRPTGYWFLMRSATPQTPYDHAIAFSLACAGCGNDCVVNVPSCCPSGRVQFPMLLQADIATTCYLCPSASCGLVWNGMDQQWEGTANVCGRIVTLKIGCAFKSLVVMDPLCASPAKVFTNSSASCDPILGTFVGQFTGIGCCGVGTINNPTVTITVYE